MPPASLSRRPLRLLKGLGAVQSSVKHDVAAISLRTDITTQEVETDTYRMTCERISNAVFSGSFLTEDDPELCGYPRITRSFKVCVFDDARISAKCSRLYNCSDLPHSMALKVAKLIADELPASGFDAKITDDGYTVMIIVARRMPGDTIGTGETQMTTVYVYSAKVTEAVERIASNRPVTPEELISPRPKTPENAVALEEFRSKRHSLKEEFQTVTRSLSSGSINEKK